MIQSYSSVNSVFLCFFGFLILSLSSCNRHAKGYVESNKPKIGEIDNLKDGQGNYVYLNENGVIKVNDKIRNIDEVCQALLSQQAFNWSIVVSPEKSIDRNRIEEIKSLIQSCYEKYRLVMAVDMYDKTYDTLSTEQKETINELYPLHLIETQGR